jgi:hypothetical protein
MHARGEDLDKEEARVKKCVNDMAMKLQERDEELDVQLRAEKHNEQFVKFQKDFRKSAESEAFEKLTKCCEEVIDLIGHLLPFATKAEVLSENEEHNYGGDITTNEFGELVYEGYKVYIDDLKRPFCYDENEEAFWVYPEQVEVADGGTKGASVIPENEVYDGMGEAA